MTNNNWPPKWLNNCEECEEKYKKAQARVQSKPSEWELREKNKCECSHDDNKMYCSAGPNCGWGGKNKYYITKDHKRLDDNKMTHHQCCSAGTSQGASLWRQSEIQFYIPKIGNNTLCETCQNTFNNLKDWEIKRKQRIIEDCPKGKHRRGSTGYSDNGAYWEEYDTVSTNNICLNCGKSEIKNGFDDSEPCCQSRNIVEKTHQNLVKGNGNSNSFSWTPLIIGGLVLAVIGIGVYFFLQKRKSSK